MTVPSNNFVINPSLLDIPGEVPIGELENGVHEEYFSRGAIFSRNYYRVSGHFSK